MVNDQNIGEEFFSAYASGRLDPALKLLVETQSMLREDVRRQLHLADTISGALLETEIPAVMSNNALDRTLALLDRKDENTEKSRRAAKIAGGVLDELILLPEPLKEKALLAAGKAGWNFAGPGLKTMPLDIQSAAKVELLRIEPGCGAPSHTHEGQEYTLVVAGGFTDETGSYGPGDISVAGPEDTHRPIADEGETCFALAVTDGNLQFKGWLGLVQKIFG